MDQVGLGILFSAKDMASGPVGALGRNFNNLRSSVAQGASRIVGGFALVAAGATSLRAGMDLLRGSFDLAVHAGEFQQTLTAVGAVTRATTEDMNLLTESAIQAGMRTQFSPQQAAEGLQSLATAGLNATAATEVLNPVLDLATGSLGQLGVAGAADAVVGTLNAYSMSASEATNVTDQLLRITQLSNFQARDFQVGLSRSAATGAQFNQQMEGTLAILGLLRNANIEASVASTSYREAVRRIYTDEGALEQLRALRIRSFDEQTGAARDAADVMFDVANATGNMTDEERAAIITRIFGVRGMITFNAVANAQTEILRDGERVTIRQADAYRYLTGELTNASGTAEDMSDRVLSTFAGQMNVLTGVVDTLKTVIGDTFAKVFRPAVKAVSDATGFLVGIWRAIPETGRFVIAGLTLAASAFLVFGGAIGVVVGGLVLVITLLGEALLIVGGVMAVIALAMAPVLLAFGALTAAVVALYYAYRENLGGVADYVDGWVSRIQLAWSALSALFSGEDLSEEIVNQLGMAENQGVNRFVWAVWGLWQRAQTVWDGLKAGFGAVWDTMGPVFVQLQAAFSELTTAVAELFGSGALGQAADMPVSEFFSLGEAIGTRLAGALRTVIQLLSWAIRQVTILLRTWEGIRPVVMPILRFWGSNFMAILRAGWSILSFFYNLNKTIADLLNPFRWIWRAVQGISNILRRERGLSEVEGGWDQAVQQSEQVRVQGARRREAEERVEAGTDRPATAEVGASQELTSLLRSIDDQLAGEGRGERATEIRTTVELDGETLGAALNRIADRQRGGQGQLVTR